MGDIKVNLEVFEGPLDLLLYLVKKAEVDIYHIPIIEITEQYLKYLELMKMLDLDVAGDFLYMASNLIYIKSKMLLPPDERLEEEEEELDPRSELIRQLIEYKKFKEAAENLHQMEGQRRLYFPREATQDMDMSGVDVSLGNVSLFDLLNAFSEILKKVEVRENLLQIFEEEVSVEDRIKVIEDIMLEVEQFAFRELFAESRSRMEMVATFLALLELIKQKRLKVIQEVNLGEILVKRMAA